MQTLQNTVLGALETVKDKLEQADESVVTRDKVFAKEEDKDKSDAQGP